MFASQLGAAAGRNMAISMSGGWEQMKQETDLSFDTIQDMIVYLYVSYSSDDDYVEVVQHVSKIYPEWTENYAVAIARAPRKPIGEG